MTLTRERKEQVIAEVAALARQSSFAMAIQYAGLGVASMTALRKAAREVDVSLRVVRNTLARRALADTHFACMTEGLSGSLILSFAAEEPGAAARLVWDFAKDHESLQVRLIAWQGRLLPVSDLEFLAKLPTLDAARSMLLGLLQSPYAGLLRTMSEVPSGCVRVLAARHDQAGS